jgi:homoserine kinase type II
VAVYTQVPAEALAAFLKRYDAGELLSAKGIAEGVSNSNFLIETTRARFILTLYERRINLAELPFFIALMEHLAAAGLPIPRPVRDRSGEALQTLAGRAACLIEYLPGVSVSLPTPAQARSVGAALASLHLASAGFAQTRANALSLPWWQATAAELAPRLDSIEPKLASLVADALARIVPLWPQSLPTGTVHADLFPDNVLMLGSTVTGLIDFYFACTDSFAYDLAVLHAAWVFPPDGSAPLAAHEAALMAGYESVRTISRKERAAFPLLAQGACLRFLLSRAQDWLAPQSGAFVTRKDPLPYARRLEHYASL